MTAIRRKAPSSEEYLVLYRAIGETVQWDQRLHMEAAELDSMLRDLATHLYFLRLPNDPVGPCEFERAGTPEVELGNFGLVPAALERGLGPWLLDHAREYAGSCLAPGAAAAGIVYFALPPGMPRDDLELLVSAHGLPGGDTAEICIALDDAALTAADGTEE